MRPFVRSLRYGYWKINHRIADRGGILLILAFIDLWYAFGLFTQTPQSRSAPINRFFFQVLPAEVWGAIWLAVAIICTIGALLAHDYIPGVTRDGFWKSDWWAFLAAVAIKGITGTMCFLAWFAGIERAYVLGAFFLGWMFLVLRFIFPRKKDPIL